MHLRTITKTTFVQVPTATFPNRNGTLVFTYLSEFETDDSWKDLTNKGKITLPKKVYAVDATGKKIPTGGTNVNVGGFDSNAPLYLKGDQVTIQTGYKYFDHLGNEVAPMNTIYTGFIAGVGSKIPIVLDLEDNMWKLKQITAANQVFPASQYTLEGILKVLLAGTGFTVNVLTNTSFGDFRTNNETVCEVLARLAKDYHFYSYFRGNELRSGSQVYIEQDAIDDGPKVFSFHRHMTYGKDYSLQGGIISEQLEYKRKDDINLSAIAYSINKIELQNTTKDGHKKTKHERLEVLVSIRNGQYVSQVKPQGAKADFAPNTAGERRTLYFWNVTDTATLITLATNELSKYFYTGLRGKFTTFGLPYVRQGDNVDLYDPLLPERSGRYKVKSVKQSGGKGKGLRQVIELDYLIQTL
jgi:hypothetical protein